MQFSIHIIYGPLTVPRSPPSDCDSTSLAYSTAIWPPRLCQSSSFYAQPGNAEYSPTSAVFSISAISVRMKSVCERLGKLTLEHTILQRCSCGKLCHALKQPRCGFFASLAYSILLGLGNSQVHGFLNLYTSSFVFLRDGNAKQSTVIHPKLPLSNCNWLGERYQMENFKFYIGCWLRSQGRELAMGSVNVVSTTTLQTNTRVDKLP